MGIEYFSDSPDVQAKNFAFKCHREESPAFKIYPVNALSFHPGSGALATGGSDRMAFVWDCSSRKRIWKLKEFPGPVSSLGFSEDGRHLGVACSYMFEEGDVADQPSPKIYLMDVEEADVMPKSQ